VRRPFAIVLTAAAAIAPGAVSAQSEPAFRLGRIDVSLQGVDLDVDSSTFREYRVLPQGFVVPYLRALGRGSLPYDLRVENGDAGGDDAVLLQALDTPPAGRRRQTNPSTDLSDRNGGVLLEDLQDLAVQPVDHLGLLMVIGS